MSYKPLCSYWATASGSRPDCEALLRAMEEQNIIPDYLHTPEGIQLNEAAGQDMAFVELESPNGRMDQWGDVVEVFARLASKFTSLDFKVREQCEELFEPTRDLLFVKGVQQDTAWGRILAPDDTDSVTVALCVDYLRSIGQTEAANMLATRFE